MTTALTTTFTPPVPCLTKSYMSTGIKILGESNYSSCMPTSFVPDTKFYYSPGFYCPVGYETACSSTVTSALERRDYETIVTCCPTGYSCQTQVAAFQWASTLGCTSVITQSNGQGINAYSVQLRFRSADFVTTSSAASSTPSSIPASTGSIPTSTAPASTGTPPPSNNDGLSTGAKAGIGIGTTLGVALIAAISWLAWVLNKNSKNKHQQKHNESELMHGHNDSGMIHNYSYNQSEFIHEAPSETQTYEASSKPVVYKPEHRSELQS
ncbi:hypothetical protein GQ44DRAFT_824469 [Phaeosphaeriaceae sp. PMI808]|nr:hypothetical protein GQ44DRAFT_824469 [Phaeosphaeriaceae sp. PMI808]